MGALILLPHCSRQPIFNSTRQTGASVSPEVLRSCRTSWKRATIVVMFLALFAMRLLEGMFFVGLVGSTVVVLISFFEDGKELIGKDDVNE
jgi:hypothetical protein